MHAYLIVEITEVRNEAAYADYRARATPTVEMHGGRYLVRGGEPVTLVGSWKPFRIVLASFETPDGPLGWWSSEDYRELKIARQQSTRSRTVVIGKAAAPEEAVDGPIGAILLVDVRKVRDEVRFAEFLDRVAETVASYGGGYLARCGNTQVLEGDWVPGRLLLIAFASIEQARGWWSSPTHTQLIAQIQDAALANVVLLRGLISEIPK